MLSCAALSSKFAIVLLKRASQLSSISSKQLNEKKEKEYEKSTRGRTAPTTKVKLNCVRDMGM